MIALYDYDPQELSPNPDAEMELAFMTGDVIYVFGEMDEDGFYMGELNGVRGLVPSNFLTEAPLETSPHHRVSHPVFFPPSSSSIFPGLQIQGQYNQFPPQFNQQQIPPQKQQERMHGQGQNLFLEQPQIQISAVGGGSRRGSHVGLCSSKWWRWCWIEKRVIQCRNPGSWRRRRWRRRIIFSYQAAFDDFRPICL